MKIYKGSILSINNNDDVFQYLVEDNGKIVFVGNDLPEKFKEYSTIDLGNKALIPAFVDTHQHFASFSTFHAGLNVMNAKSNIEIKEMIKDFVKKNNPKSLICFGASPYSVKEGVLISKKEIDEVCSNIDVTIIKYDGHACILNSKLLNKLKSKLSNLRGYHFESGEMNQDAFFKVSEYITKSISIPKLVKNMQNAMNYLAHKGIGMVHTVSGVGFPLNLDINLEKWVGRSAQSGIQFRVFPQPMDVKVAQKKGLPRIGGCFQCALDGCFGSQDAALNESYQNSDDYGVLYYTDEKVIEFCKQANRAGLQIEMHAIGDKAFNQATKALKAALDDFPRDNHRHTIIHACLPTKEGLSICKKYKINIAMQTSFINWAQEPDSYLNQILVEERLMRLNPTKQFFDLGLVVGAGSDAPCTDPDPIVWIDRAVNNPNKSEAITIKQALRMCTYNGYYISFDEKERGSLEVGKIADMVILSNNPYSIASEDIKNLKVEQTILNGKEYKNQKQSFIVSLIKGIFSKKKI